MREPSLKMMTGGQAVVECIRRHGVRHVFNVPGESYLAVLDALYDAPGIKVITNRQEGGACYMAEAYAKATRKVGVCFVTRGPGATNASIGVHCAAQDSTPLVLFVGQVPRKNKGRESFQEVDYGRFFGDMAKWVVEIDQADKVPEMVNRAFHIAQSGRPGPVVVALPEDMLVEEAEMLIVDPTTPAPAHPDPGQIRAMVQQLEAAERPVVLVGSGTQYTAHREDATAREALIRFAERFKAPVLTSWRRNDAFPNSHGHYGGNLAIGKSPAQELVRQADLLLVIGDRLSEITTDDYRLIAPGKRIIQVHAQPEMIGRHFPTELGVTADAGLALQAALECPAPAENPARMAYVREAHQRYMDFSTSGKPRETPHTAYEQVMADLNEVLPEDAIFTVDAGNSSVWIQRFRRYETPDSFFGPIVGSMGYGLPSAIAAKVAHPDRVVIGTCGDGGILMNGQELATAVQYGIKIVQLVFNNSTYGTIRMHQEREFPERVVATDLVNPDFAAMARSFGAEGYTVKTDKDFRPALEAALSAEKPALIDIITDKEHLSVAMTLSEIRGGQAAQKVRPRKKVNKGVLHKVKESQLFI